MPRTVVVVVAALLIALAGCGEKRPVGAVPLANTPGMPPHSIVGENSASIDVMPFQVAGLIMPVAREWQAMQPEEASRVAQFRLPDPQGADGPGDAQLVVSFFGTGQGGSPQANIRRWLGQMENPVEPDEATRQQNGVRVHLLRVNGRFAPGAMPGRAAPEPIDDARLFGLIVESGRNMVFFKAVGPRATMAAHEDALLLMTVNIQPAP